MPYDLELAVLPHATSKISSIDDLNSLETLGFRGEALPSIASVSRLSIMSRPPQEISGYEIRIEGGNLLSKSAVGCPIGTVVTVQDLFYNTPARLKFLRSASTEFGYISDMVSKLALARPDVAFSLRHPQNLVLNTPGRGDLRETIATILGNDTARRLLPLTLDEDNLQVSGFISPPELVRSSPNSITFILNGRVIRSHLLNQALKEGYYTLIPAGTYPMGVIALTMSPAEYDVNVHPAKLEVKFHAEKDLCNTISKVVRDTLLASKPIRGITSPLINVAAREITDHKPTSGRSSMTRSMDHPTDHSEQLKFIYRPLPDKYANNNTNKLGSEKSYLSEIKFPAISQPSADTKVQPKKLAESDGNQTIIAEPSGQNYSQTQPDNRRLLFEDLRPIGQLFSTYVLCTDENSLYIIDQHAAHERMQYEELLLNIKHNQISSQLLLISETVDLTIQEEQILLQNLTELQEIGFIIEHFGERTYFLRGIPILNHLDNPGRIFRDFLDEMVSSPFSPSKHKLLESWIFMVACRTAIKGSDRLSISEMEQLIQQLATTANPLTCPHGRPIIIEISKKELEKRFSR